MPKSYSSVYAHIVFSTHDRFPFLAKPIRARVHEYIGGVARNIGAKPVSVGGIEDHAHMLVSIPPTLAIADAVERIKTNSSKWIHETFRGLRDFGWQRGYGAFSVSPSNVEAVREYIENQEQHHKKRTFQEEFLDLLLKSGIEFDERYIWK